MTRYTRPLGDKVHSTMKNMVLIHSWFEGGMLKAAAVIPECFLPVHMRGSVHSTFDHQAQSSFKSFAQRLGRTAAVLRPLLLPGWHFHSFDLVVVNSSF